MSNLNFGRYKGFLTKLDVANEHGVSQKEIDTARKRGELPFKRIGKYVLFRPEWVEQWLNTPDPIRVSDDNDMSEPIHLLDSGEASDILLNQ